MLTIERTGRTSSRATVPQQYFYYLRKYDPEPSSYGLALGLTLHGPLDGDVLKRTVEGTVARHSVFQTALREVDGKLVQLISPDAPRLELELEDRSSLSETDRLPDLERVSAELIASGIDLVSGRTSRARLVRFAPDMHALILTFDHGVVDAASLFMLHREIVRCYSRGGAATEESPALQYIDYAEALDRLARSPTGLARREWWRAKLHDTRPVIVPGDFPRAPVDARRAAAPLGIVAEPTLIGLVIELPSAVRQAIGRVATEETTSASIVYLAAYAWLLRELSGQDDLCIETVYNPRSEHSVERLQGAVVAWTMLRLEIAGCRTLRDAIRSTKGAMQEASDHYPIPDYYETVPAELRGPVFNYMPMAWGNRATNVGELRIEPWHGRYPKYKRTWELMMFVMDSTQRGIIELSGNENLFRQETIEVLARRYVGVLEHQLD